jgi:hypothetical protein
MPLGKGPPPRLAPFLAALLAREPIAVLTHQLPRCWLHVRRLPLSQGVEAYRMFAAREKGVVRTCGAAVLLSAVHRVVVRCRRHRLCVCVLPVLPPS